MSIRPIDLKMAIPQTQEISKVEQNNQDKLRFSLESQTNKQNQTIDQELKKVNDSEELSKAEIKDEKEKQEKQEKERQEENSLEPQSLQHHSSEGNVGKDYTRGSTIDIKA